MYENSWTCSTNQKKRAVTRQKIFADVTAQILLFLHTQAHQRTLEFRLGDLVFFIGEASFGQHFFGVFFRFFRTGLVDVRRCRPPPCGFHPP